MKTIAWLAKTIAWLAMALLSGCAGAQWTSSGDCKAETDRLNGLLGAAAAERQKMARAAGRREETLRRQLEAMKSIERGILERDDRMRSETTR